MKRRVVMVVALTLAAMVGMAAPAWAQDGPTIGEVAVSLDTVFVLFAAVLVIFMQAGFALVEAGLTRGKNVANIMMKNLMDFAMGVLAFFAVGFGIAFGAGNALFGTEGWFLEGMEPVGNLSVPVFFLFQVAFAATAATIVSGAMAERTKFRAYLAYSVVISALVYPVVVHWVWGGGWLSRRETPFVDFAGSTVVHSVGGWAALMGAALLGPRIGKYGADGRPRPIPAHSVPFAVIGTFVLLVGWYGFNPGSQLAADPVIADIALTTTLSAAAGALMAMLVVWLRTGKPDVSMTANGLLAGLVGITAGCAAVDNWAALAIGAVAGAVVVGSVLFFDRVRVDDPVGAISVHGVCGAWGTLAVGLFARDGGLLLGDGADQLVTQAVGVAAVAGWTLAAAAVLFLVIKATIGLRVSEEEELEGLDVHEHGSPGYGELVVVRGSGTRTGALVPGTIGVSIQDDELASLEERLARTPSAP